MDESLIHVDLIDLSVDVANRNELFMEVSKKLGQKGYINDDYVDALNKREKEFPTGLETKSLNIALPHTDTEYVKHPFVFIAKTNRLIEFLQMGDNKPLDCNYFLFLGIKDPKNQVSLLANLIGLFTNEEFVSDFKKIDNDIDMYKLLKEKI